ncbi:TetR family transcriptional regulator [Streptomyces sp. NBC_01433]|uniref:TetR family transcriptional regulator n=1 Tax=Streptomyces sp. NBC_01433 TaxID=2903864 RepID=UPI0022567A91|nr:TetR family transcriptional regulator [Streptomyces sp. NBC_01433]MCX4676471.1 TetR family transcriptional regulator [Streptomyces sp. NBC_01433]
MSQHAESVGTRARLLAAAREEFATHGMGGARVGRIAEQSGANKERIYSYFGSKEKLFAAVVAEALAEQAALLGLPTGDPAEYAGRIYDLHQQNPHLLRLMMWEALHYGTGTLPAEEQRTARYGDMVTELSATLNTPTPTDPRAAHTFLALLGIAVLPAAFPQLTRLILGPAADTATTRAHVVELARRMTTGAPVSGETSRLAGEHSDGADDLIR